MTAPLEGVRAIEWATLANGPMIGVQLGWMGADVIKVEERGVGDMARKERSRTAGEINNESQCPFFFRVPHVGERIYSQSHPIRQIQRIWHIGFVTLANGTLRYRVVVKHSISSSFPMFVGVRFIRARAIY